MKYIMCARAFPVFHPRAGQPTFFRDSILNGTKIHTLRNRAGNKKTGEIVSLREWSDLPYRSKQVEFAQCAITVNRLTIDEEQTAKCAIHTLAFSDGFPDTQDFRHWFTKGRDEPIVFDGVRIHFLDVVPKGDQQ